MAENAPSRCYVFTFFPRVEDYAVTGLSDFDLGYQFLDVWSNGLFPSPPVKYAIGQLEECPTTGAAHIQGYIELTRAMRITQLKSVVPQLASAHFQKRLGTRDEAIAYCKKEETRVGDWVEFGDPHITQGHRSDLDSVANLIIKEKKTVREVADIAPGTFIRYHSGIERLAFLTAEQPSAEINFQPRPWQKWILDRIDERPDDRTILWVHDSKGNTGKSRLAMHLCRNYNAMLLDGKIADMAYMWTQRPAPIAIFDISRSAAELSNHLYTFAEKLKNGMLTNTKYISRQVFFDVPHVIFFSNSMPQEGKWSEDRVKIIDLDTWQPLQTTDTIMSDGWVTAGHLFM